MLKDEAFHTQVESAIGEAEQGTSAEIVVVFAGASGSYRDTALLAGALAAFTALAVLVLAPIRLGIFDEVVFSRFTVRDLVGVGGPLLAFGVAALIFSRSRVLQRLLTTRRRRMEQVRTQAMLAFHEEGVTATVARNGILIYVSLLEWAVEILPDIAIEDKIPAETWEVICEGLRKTGSKSALSERIIEAIRSAGATLAAEFPPGEENPDEISNRPRIRD